MTSRCAKCDNFGFYFDPQCKADTCDHGPRKVVVEEVLDLDDLRRGRTPRKTIKSVPRIMDCPPRACSCSAGNGLRQKLKLRARRQAEAFELAGSQR